MPVRVSKPVFIRQGKGRKNVPVVFELHKQILQYNNTFRLQTTIYILDLGILFNFYSYLRSFYDTLKVKRNATTKEIRDAFLKLSKQFHPDINKNPNAHKEFLKIQEAYNVLSKPSSRATYDLGISNPSSNYSYGPSSGPSHGPHTTSNQGYSRPRYGGPFRSTYGQYGRNPWDDPYFYRNRDRSEFNHEAPYYGIRGIKRQSNGRVAFFLGVFTVVMFVVQMMAIRDLRRSIRERNQRYREEVRASIIKELTGRGS